MKRPRLIKKEERTTTTPQSRPTRPGRADRRQSDRRGGSELLLEWVDGRRRDREDPRKAFAALFSQPQIS